MKKPGNINVFGQTLLALTLLAVPLVVSAQTSPTPPPTAQPDPHGHAHPQPAPAVRPQPAAGVAQFIRVFTEEQRTQFHEAMEANREKVQELQNKIRTTRKEMLDLQLADKFNESAFRAQSETAAKYQMEIELLNAQAFNKIRPSLTDEQITKIKTQTLPNRGYGGPEARPGVFPQGAPAMPRPQFPTNAPRLPPAQP